MANARKSEAKGSKTADIKWRGHTFVVSTEYEGWTVDFVESLEEGKAVGIVRGALGPEQWRVVKSLNLNMADLADLSDAISVGMGFGDTGESSASSD